MNVIQVHKTHVLSIKGDGLCFFLARTSRHKEHSQDVTEDDLGEADDALDKDTPKVSAQSEAFDEAIKTPSDDDEEILISY